jgi:hypothetical protein
MESTAASLDALRLDDVQTRHADLINGLQSVYNLLADLQLISSDAIISPPEFPGHNMRPEVLGTFGYDEETIALIRHLPWLSDELVHEPDGLVVAPAITTAMNYFSNRDNSPYMVEEWEHPRRGGYEIGSGERDLELYMLRITNGNWKHELGYHYIYNSRDCEQSSIKRSKHSMLIRKHRYDGEMASKSVSSLLVRSDMAARLNSAVRVGH